MADKRKSKRIVSLGYDLKKVKGKSEEQGKEIAALKDALAKANMRESAMAQMIVEVRTAVTGKRPGEGDKIQIDTFFREIVQGLAFLQIELKRLSVTSTTTLFPHEIERIEHSCLRCAGPKDPYEDKPANIKEAEERAQWLSASCRSQKSANGIALGCPMFNPQVKEEPPHEGSERKPESDPAPAPPAPGGDTPGSGG